MRLVGDSLCSVPWVKKQVEALAKQDHSEDCVVPGGDQSGEEKFYFKKRMKHCLCYEGRGWKPGYIIRPW